MTVTEEILDLYQRGGNDAYFGEDVTQLQHALQAAASAVEAHADDELVVAALLHDIGHLLPGDNYHDEIGVVDHDQTCIEWLTARGFSARLIALVSGHVSAKRYLVTTKTEYRNRLSPTSQRTLELQGGAMTSMEVEVFETHLHFRDVLRLRTWDEQAKDPGRTVPGLETYLPRIELILGQA
jgi:predicted HD phosphohydrolase